MSLRQVIDASLIMAVILPAAGATAYSNSIDLGTGPHVEKVELRLELPATPALVKDKIIVLAVQDSDDGVDFADVASIPAVTVTGGDPAGGDPVLFETRIPSSTRRYIQLRATVDAAGGDNTALSATLTPLM